jgi:hypothetical protein
MSRNEGSTQPDVERDGVVLNWDGRGGGGVGEEARNLRVTAANARDPCNSESLLGEH